MISLHTSVSHASALQCSQCQQTYALTNLATFSPCCHKPLLTTYHTPFGLSPTVLASRPFTMWRYREMLPLFDDTHKVTLGEGGTPILSLKKWANRYGYQQLLLKDESLNPTGSFKARGLSMAISKAKELGVEACIIPTAGNAGGAMAAYCASANLKATMVMPRHTPKVFKEECELYGADLVLVDGLINDCGKKVAELKAQNGYFDVSTMKEPYRLEGKKTMGYEIAEQFNWQLPDVILYPAGGGTGLIGIWKAFFELKALGWLSPSTKLPRMYAIQAENCCPVVTTWNKKQPNASHYQGKPSVANGLAVPQPFAEALMLDVLRESGGIPIAVSEDEMVQTVKEVARLEGLLVAPEGAALFKGLQKLIENKHIDPSENVLLINTGSGYKYLENLY